MDISLPEAAQLLGKTERQLRYLIREQRIRAKKVGQRWTVDGDSPPLTAAQRTQS